MKTVTTTFIYCRIGRNFQLGFQRWRVRLPRGLLGLSELEGWAGHGTDDIHREGQVGECDN